ncbi:MAG TPA: S24 family peptidase [Patescibacteria group bacterium]|nr:S24 family peptidase [Patescibacteria group bacterium]
MANEWISERLRSLKKTKSGLAKTLGVDPARVSEIIGGRRNVQVSELPLMAEVLEMTTTELVDLLASRHSPAPRAESAAAAAPPASSTDGFLAQMVDIPGFAHLQRNLPVYGSAMGGADGAFEMNGQVMDYVERPPALAGAKNAYGLYVQGESMSPRFEAGWLVHVNPNRPVRRGDNVVIQVRAHDEHAPPLAYVKVFECRTPTKLVVRQFNPPAEMEWPNEDVVSIHRVIGTAEM